MAQKALHYDATCHYFMVTSSNQGIHTAAQRQTCHLAGQDPAGFASTWAVFLTNQAAWEENLLLASRASTFD